MKQFVIYDSKEIIKDICYTDDKYIASSELPYGIYRICEKKIKMDRKTKKQLKKALLIMKKGNEIRISVQIKTHYINDETQKVEFYRKPRIQVIGGKLKFYKIKGRGYINEANK